MTRKITGTLFMALGVLLIFPALTLFLFNERESRLAGKTAMNILPEIQIAIAENIVSAPETTVPLPPELLEEDYEMPVTEINGHGYIGYLTVPVLDLELPVMSEWSYPKLRIAPCRQFGATRTNDLVIAAHNYQQHFGRLSSLTDTDFVIFTDMAGELTFYRVGCVDIIPPDSTDEVENSPWDLVLYTCTYGGKTRVMVGCQKITPEELAALTEQGKE